VVGVLPRSPARVMHEGMRCRFYGEIGSKSWEANISRCHPRVYGVTSRANCGMNYELYTNHGTRKTQCADTASY
jgi:hypothetical protein